MDVFVLECPNRACEAIQDFATLISRRYIKQ